MPWLKSYLKERQESSGATKPLSEVEKNFLQPEYHIVYGLFEDFSEMAIQVCSLNFKNLPYNY